MDQSYWEKRWVNHETGFHRDETHPFLEAYFSSLELPQGSTVLVPLCGKSLDILFLRERGHQVVGFEFSELAIKDFFKENNLSYEHEQVGEHVHYRSDGISIYQGDFLSFPKSELDGQQLSGAFDRAAMVALPPAMRKDYYAKMASLYPSGSKTLCNKYEYDGADDLGPPFSVPMPEVRENLEGAFKIQVLEESRRDMDHPRLKKEGCSYSIESALLLTRQ